MIELQILLLFITNKDIYNNYYNYLDFVYLKNNYQIIYKLYQVVNLFYDKYPEKESISFEDLESMYLINYPVHKEQARTELDSVLTQLRATSTDSDVIRDLLEQHRVRAIAQEVAVLALDVSEGRTAASELVDKVDSLRDATSETNDDMFVTSNLESLYDENVAAPGLRWRQPFLNKALGSLRKGDFGFLYARPETGKTTFLASEITYMAQQATGPILWFNNEEQGSKVMLRCYQAALGYTLTELFTDRDDSMQQYEALTNDRIKIFDEPSLTKDQVANLCSSLNPSLIIFDQIDKVAGFASDRRDLEMGKIYRWARELSKRYAPVIGVCQADGTGEGVRYLTMNHVADAKTAKQAEADWILGIGKTHDEGFANVRFFNISKNKLLGDEDSNPSLRHGSAAVVIEPERARYKDISEKKVR